MYKRDSKSFTLSTYLNKLRYVEIEAQNTPDSNLEQNDIIDKRKNTIAFPKEIPGCKHQIM